MMIMMKGIDCGRQTSSNLVFWSSVLNGRMKQCQINLSCGENTRVDSMKAAQINRLIVEYKIKELAEFSQSLQRGQNVTQCKK